MSMRSRSPAFGLYPSRDLPGSQGGVQLCLNVGLDQADSSCASLLLQPLDGSMCLRAHFSTTLQLQGCPGMAEFCGSLSFSKGWLFLCNGLCYLNRRREKGAKRSSYGVRWTFYRLTLRMATSKMLEPLSTLNTISFNLQQSGESNGGFGILSDQ